ncbi:hypothetical protein EYF80_012282 [Liparis tanakae]|uniref:Uncharacterized protein n=1 Tax=Liparis tanakae TaxID=230148 RepID=A0A4Z2IHZ2_9TELE|nr:hypothetical protein EYF80_012282 [Liparis tanakae]
MKTAVRLASYRAQRTEGSSRPGHGRLIETKHPFEALQLQDRAGGGGGGRVLALFLRERDVPGGRRFGFWLGGSLVQALRGSRCLVRHIADEGSQEAPEQLFLLTAPVESEAGVIGQIAGPPRTHRANVEKQCDDVSNVPVLETKDQSGVPCDQPTPKTSPPAEPAPLSLQRKPDTCDIMHGDIAPPPHFTAPHSRERSAALTPPLQPALEPLHLQRTPAAAHLSPPQPSEARGEAGLFYGLALLQRNPAQVSQHLLLLGTLLFPCIESRTRVSTRLPAARGAFMRSVAPAHTRLASPFIRGGAPKWLF